jgi:hypothetical protein
MPSHVEVAPLNFAPPIGPFIFPVPEDPAIVVTIDVGVSIEFRRITYGITALLSDSDVVYPSPAVTAVTQKEPVEG